MFTSIHYKPLNVPLNEYEGYIKRREYWDDLATEWGWSPKEEKIIRLAGFVQQGGNLKKIINSYAKNHDEIYRQRIQYCILSYILKIMTNGRIHAYSKSPFVDRIKRLDKDELVKLLSDQLKTSVKQTYQMENGGINPVWEIKYDNPLTPDELLDKIDRKHSRKYPEESINMWWQRSDYWWDNRHYLW